MVGKNLSHFRILEKLGEGGMGVVYKATDLKLNRTVALKFLPAASSDSDVRRLQQEAEMLSSLNHTNIATVFDVDEDDGRRFIVLEYLEGGTLRGKLQSLRSVSKKFSGSEIIVFASQIASALAHAHKRSVIHRDIKTENIMLAGDGSLKVTDFGLARLAGSTITKSRGGAGTAAYMSPEQVRGETVDHRTDIFSFGVVLYELATGRLPFEGDHEAAVLYSILNKDVTGLETEADLPPRLRQVILRCLEKEKENRYQRCDEILEELTAIRSGESTSTGTMLRRPVSRWVVLSLLMLPVAGGLAFLLSTILPGLTVVSESGPPSIAVLYMESLDEKPGGERFAAGTTEEIINELANIPGLKVVSRTDVQVYRGKAVDIQEIGRKLGVAYVLESSMRTEGSRVRVTCQAIQTEDRFHFWSRAYTREMKGEFEVQTEIARQVAIGLKARFAQRELERKLGLEPNSLLKQEGTP